MKMTWRVWLLIACIVLSLVAISPSFKTGAVIKSVEMNSEASKQGIRSGEILQTINGKTISTAVDYSNVISELFVDGKEQRIEIVTDKNSYVWLTNQTPQITVDNIPTSKIQTGLDLRGGARALVEPNATLTDAQLQDLVAISRNRFNVYGLSDINIQGVSDLSGKKFMLIEVAGASPNDLQNLVSQQGKFEAKVGNTSVFEGGKKDISDVCRNDASCAGIKSCGPVQGGVYACNFVFTIYLTSDAAQKHADVTEKLSLDDTGQYLNESLYLYVDGSEVDTLRISSDLRGQVATQISIQGSGTGSTQDLAMKDAKAQMNRLQTILLTGSLPYKLNIVKLDTISPSLGNEFVFIILFAGIASVVIVSIVIFARYRKFKLSLALLLTSFSEIVIILGVSALIKWNLDLPSIAGILATIGTGVDSQIVIMDEAAHNKSQNMKDRMKRALFIILASYLTLLVAMLPLYWAGAGLFKGFAITTILGVTIGILITRPAFADIVKQQNTD